MQPEQIDEPRRSRAGGLVMAAEAMAIAVAARLSVDNPDRPVGWTMAGLLLVIAVVHVAAAVVCVGPRVAATNSSRRVLFAIVALNAFIAPVALVTAALAKVDVLRGVSGALGGLAMAAMALAFVLVSRTEQTPLAAQVKASPLASRQGLAGFVIALVVMGVPAYLVAMSGARVRLLAVAMLSLAWVITKLWGPRSVSYRGSMTLSSPRWPGDEGVQTFEHDTEVGVITVRVEAAPTEGGTRVRVTQTQAVKPRSVWRWALFKLIGHVALARHLRRSRAGIMTAGAAQPSGHVLAEDLGPYLAGDPVP